MVAVSGWRLGMQTRQLGQHVVLSLPRDSGCDVIASLPKHKEEGWLAWWGNWLPLTYAQCCPSGQGGHGIDSDHRGLDRHSTAADAGAAADYPRAGFRFLLASERVEVVAEV